MFIRYVAALYWAFATMTSVGYGDVVAVTVLEQLMAIVCMVIGVTVFAYLMGAVTSILGALNSSQSRITAKKQRIDEFLKNRKVAKRRNTARNGPISTHLYVRVLLGGGLSLMMDGQEQGPSSCCRTGAHCPLQ